MLDAVEEESGAPEPVLPTSDESVMPGLMASSDSPTGSLES